MTTYQKQQLPPANEDGRFGPVTVKVGNISKFWKPGERPFMGLDLIGRDGHDWWKFREHHSPQAVRGATLTVMLTCNPKQEGDGFYQDVDEIIGGPAQPQGQPPAVGPGDDQLAQEYEDHRSGGEWNAPPAPNTGYAMDLKDLSIREQAMFNHTIVVAMDWWKSEDPQKFDAMLAAVWQTGLRMMAPEVRERILGKYKADIGTEE
jgi:hypothetical protein